MFSVLIDPILPVFAILFIGFVAGRMRWTSDADARVLNRFAMAVLLPIFIFRALALAPLAAFEVGPLLLYALVEALLYFAGYQVARHVFGRGPRESLLLGFCCIFANNAYYVLPLSQLLYDEASTLPITSIIILDATFAFGCTMVALDVMEGRDAGASAGKAALRIAKLPIVWALGLGAVFGLGLLPLPAPIETFATFVGQAASPVALFAMGVILAATQLRPTALTAFVGTMKIAVFPLAIWATLTAFSDASPSTDMFVLGSAGPSGVMAFSLALLYGVRTDAIMQVIVWTSVLTLGTLAWLA